MRLDGSGQNPLVGRAIRLFEFLARGQQLKTGPPRTLDTYQRDGAVVWLANLPEHPAVVTAHRVEDPQPDALLVSIDRLPRETPPDVPEELRVWLSGAADDPNQPPTLRETIAVNERVTDIDERPEIRKTFDRWLDSWRAWADQELFDQPVRALYSELFSTYVTATGHPEELELVAGVGCLAWTPPGHDPVRRHLLTAPIAIHFDDDTGQLTVRRVESIDAVTVELDMLDPGLVANPQHVNAVRAQARELETNPLHRRSMGQLVRRLVHTLDADGEYQDQDDAPEWSPRAAATFAPAIILRKRTQQGLVEILQTIVSQLAEANEVPDGVLPLIDPDHRPQATSSSTPGALVMVDDDPFLPLPVNDVQLRILRQVDTKAQTLVQGPPGTGKTHTAAALLSHLLAQGKRVLVTAHTDRALKEVRDKLPIAIKPLSVAVVGTSREDMSDLKIAVERIAATSAEHDPHAAAEKVRECLEQIDRLRRKRAALYRQLVDARGREVVEHEHAGYRGTLAAIAHQLEVEAVHYGWLNDFVQATSFSNPPLTSPEIAEWRTYLLDGRLAEDEPEAHQRRITLSAVPDPSGFADLVAAERAAITADEQNTALKNHAAFNSMSQLDSEVRNQIQQRLRRLADDADDLTRRREAWMTDALADVRSGRAGIWQSRARQIAELIGRSAPLVARLGSMTEVTVAEGDIGSLVALATGLREYLGTGNKLKASPDGTPKIGAFAPKAVKHGQPLFDRVRVNHLPPTTTQQLDAFLTWAEAIRSLAALDRSWPASVRVPFEDTLQERLQWHSEELKQLHRVLQLGAALEDEERRLAGLRLPRPDWSDLGEFQIYARLIDAADVQDARAAAVKPLQLTEEVIEVVARWADTAPCVQLMLSAVRQRDHESYASAHARTRRLDEVNRITERRDELAERLRATASALAEAIEHNPHDTSWNARLDGFEKAWAWSSTGTWVVAQESVDTNALQAEVAVIEKRIRDQVEMLSATRAWNHAVSPDRLTGQARADLQQYAGLVRRLGKGTGVYAAQRRAEIRQAMERCRPAVPVWIMPIYRIAEQFRVQPDMFDVVIVDEASQAGLEATFLQYLAPKMVVIGDDRQVSPTAVGVNQQQLRDLAVQYLPDDRYRASWQDPQRSLFDEAKMRYRGLLTLTEHRRCVPEIIGFSNRIAYEPEDIRLIPVRQYGIDRLEPIKAVFLADGYTRGTTNKINPVEIDAVVNQIEKCVADPRYDGLTFGVISLLAGAQAKAIEKALLDRIPPEEWTARQLRCGDSADFQGSERDVMFLSMVAALEPGKPMVPLTRDLYVQRYNVAASRAKDQMWVFHSVRLTDLGNPEDMRFQLLDYCYGVLNRSHADHEGGITTAVPDDRRIEPFDSLFEQRVFNQLIDCGYTVVSQYPVESYKLDLVVVGAKARLAIECDGDAWHGPDAYQRDLARQRDLERCGWHFFRVRESAFYVDRQAVLGELRSVLSELDIHPTGWIPEQRSEPVLSQQNHGSVRSVTAGDVPAEMDSQDDDEQTVDLLSFTDAPVRDDSPFAVYEAFTDGVIPVSDATRQQLLEGIHRIVALEGPVLGHRLHNAYVRASGGQRVGNQIAKTLNLAISSAVRQGILVEENPLGEAGVKARTYRLSEQPAVRLRQLGPRPFEHVPPGELAAVLSHAAATNGWTDEESLYRAALELLGLKRLTANVYGRFVTVLGLARG